MPPKPETATLTFEEALKELETLVTKLEKGQVDLETAIADYERGMFLKRFCEQKLEAARLKVERITEGADGKVSAEPFEA